MITRIYAGCFQRLVVQLYAVTGGRGGEGIEVSERSDVGGLVEHNKKGWVEWLTFP